MAVREPRYSKEDFARRGDAIYHDRIRPRLSPEDMGKVIAIDIETCEWEMDPDEAAACRRLEARCPDAQTWLVRAGSRSVRHFGRGRSAAPR